MDVEKWETFYRATTFLVHSPNGKNIPLHIGKRHPDFDDLLPPDCKSWAFLTACNPRSEVFAHSENVERMRSLLEDISETGYVFWSGLGVSDISDWKPEESILVFGMPRDEAHLLAERYHQNAFVYGERGGVAELLWTKEIQGL